MQVNDTSLVQIHQQTLDNLDAWTDLGTELEAWTEECKAIGFGTYFIGSRGLRTQHNF